MLLTCGILASSTATVFAASGSWSHKYADFSGYLYKGASAKTVVNRCFNGDGAYVYMEGVNGNGCRLWSQQKYGGQTAYTEKVSHPSKVHSAHGTQNYGENHFLWIWG